MRSLLTQLQNNEAVLLMYLANELPAEDRAEVEAHLQQDENLRAHLADLREAYSVVETAVRGADASTPMRSPFMAARAFGDVIRQQQMERKPVEEKEEQNFWKLRWYVYPVAAAAAVALGMLVWWQTASKLEREPNPLVSDGTYDEFQRDSLAQTAIAAWDTPQPDAGQVDVQRQLEVLTYLRNETLH